MAGFLPGTRPLAENYGPPLVDDKPIEDPERELGATQINAMRDDVAYVARMSPLLVFLVSLAGVVSEYRGPEGTTSADVTVTVGGMGGNEYTIDWSATGVSGVFALPIGYDSCSPFAGTQTATTVVVLTRDLAYADAPLSFVVMVF